MKDTLKCIASNLYERQYQTSTGRWNKFYYGIFVDWKGKRRKFPLGSDLKTAKQELQVLKVDNIRKKDFDQEKIDLEKAKNQDITLEVWLKR